MNKKIPPEAFLFYVELGRERSYEAVAERFDCSRRGVAECAKRERWQERIAELEGRAQERVEAAALDSIAAMNERHLKIARYLQSRGLEALQSGRTELIARATRTVSEGVALERLVRGEPTERVENFDAINRRERERWLVDDRASAAQDAAEQAGEGSDGGAGSQDTPEPDDVDVMRSAAPEEPLAAPDDADR